MVQQKTIGDSGPISSRIKQPSKIRTCPASHRMAGGKSDNHHRCRYVGCHLWKYPESLYQLYHRRSRKNQTHLYLGRKAFAGSFQSSASKLHSLYHQQYEGEYRTLSRRRDHRGVSGSQKRTGVSDYLFLTSFQNGLVINVNCSSLHHGNGSIRNH